MIDLEWMQGSKMWTQLVVDEELNIGLSCLVDRKWKFVRIEIHTFFGTHFIQQNVWTKSSLNAPFLVPLQTLARLISPNYTPKYQIAMSMSLIHCIYITILDQIFLVRCISTNVHYLVSEVILSNETNFAILIVKYPCYDYAHLYNLSYSLSPPMLSNGQINEL